MVADCEREDIWSPGIGKEQAVLAEDGSSDGVETVPIGPSTKANEVGKTKGTLRRRSRRLAASRDSLSKLWERIDTGIGRFRV